MSQQPISIIGAGLGGLTLARCLSQRGISTVLFEKAPNTARHGYGITLHASTYRPLLKALGIDESTFKSRVAVDAASGGAGLIDSRKLICYNQIDKDSFRANRASLEGLLREGLDIQWEHGIKKLDILESTNTLLFQNGDRAENSFVIGADGVHSNIRKGVLPDVELNILPFVTFNGKRRVQRSTFDRIYAPAMKNANIIETSKNGTVLQVSLNDIAEEVSISWVFSRPAQGVDDRLYMPNRPLSGATNIPEELYKEVECLADLDQPFEEVFNVQKMRADRILSWLMRTVEVDSAALERLAKSNVFLLGDAAHAEPILGGEGANAAMVDAIELAKVIADNGVGAIHDWYMTRFSAWKKSIDRSKKEIKTMHTARL